jgi:polyisoprenoid-binding protein YceI
MRKIISIAILLCIASIAQSQTWGKVKSTTVNFKIKNAGIGVVGKFLDVKANVLLDESNIKNSTFSGVVKVASVSTGLGLRDKHIKEKSEFFDEAKFPIIEISSSKVQTTPTIGLYKVEWKITIKGITKYVWSEVNTNKTKDEILLTTNFTMNRRDWGVGGKSIMMNDNVKLNISCSLTQ